MSTAIADRPLSVVRGQWSQPCPECDGVITGDDLKVGRWKLIQGKFDSWYQRKISMYCPHCGHTRTNVEPSV